MRRGWLDLCVDDVCVQKGGGHVYICVYIELKHRDGSQPPITHTNNTLTQTPSMLSGTSPRRASAPWTLSSSRTTTLTLPSVRF